MILYDSTLSHDDFNDLKSNKRNGNRIMEYYGLRIWLFARLELIKEKVELLIADIDKELERLDK